LTRDERQPQRRSGRQHAHASTAIGEPRERKGGQHENDATEALESEEQRVGDTERLLDVGTEDLQGHPIELLEDREEEKNHGDPVAATTKALAHRHGLDHRRADVVGLGGLVGPVLLFDHDRPGQIGHRSRRRRRLSIPYLHGPPSAPRIVARNRF